MLKLGQKQQLLDGRNVENKGKLILDEKWPENIILKIMLKREINRGETIAMYMDVFKFWSSTAQSCLFLSSELAFNS